MHGDHTGKKSEGETWSQAFSVVSVGRMGEAD